MPSRALFNPATQQSEPADFSVDANNEIVATFADGRFLKFPAGLAPDEFEQQLSQVETDNLGQVVITAEMLAAQDAARANSEALIGLTPDNAMSDSQSNDSQIPLSS